MKKPVLFLYLLFAFLFAQTRAGGHKHHKDWCLVEPECQLITKSCANDAFRECKHARDCADGAACMTVQRCNTNRAACSVNSDCKAVQVECASDMDCPFTRCKGVGKCSHTTSSCFSDSDCSHGEACLRLNGTCVSSGKRCFRDMDCPTYPCDMSGKMIWADEDGEESHGLHKREIFLLVWCIGVCLVLCFFCLCWCRGTGSSSRQGGGGRPGRRIITGGGGGVQVHVTGQDDDDEEDASDQDDDWERRSPPVETTIYLGPGQRRRRTKGKVVRRNYSEV